MVKQSLLICSMILIGCASSFPFGHKYYGLQGVDFSKGHLIGALQKDDLPFEVCRDINEERQCVVFKLDDFSHLVDDYLELKNRLKDCEASR